MVSLVFVIFVIWATCLVAGFAIRRHLGLSQLTFVIVIIFALTPWLWHHLSVISMAEQWQAQENQAAIALDVYLAAPIFVAFFTLIIGLMPRKLWFIVTALPIIAFLVTYFFTIPALIETTDFHFDGYGINTLFVFTVGAFILSFAYSIKKPKK